MVIFPTFLQNNFTNTVQNFQLSNQYNFLKKLVRLFNFLSFSCVEWSLFVFVLLLFVSRFCGSVDFEFCWTRHRLFVSHLKKLLIPFLTSITQCNTHVQIFFFHFNRQSDIEILCWIRGIWWIVALHCVVLFVALRLVVSQCDNSPHHRLMSTRLDWTLCLFNAIDIWDDSMKENKRYYSECGMAAVLVKFPYITSVAFTSIIKNNQNNIQRQFKIQWFTMQHQWFLIELNMNSCLT